MEIKYSRNIRYSSFYIKKTNFKKLNKDFQKANKYIINENFICNINTEVNKLKKRIYENNITEKEIEEYIERGFKIHIQNIESINTISSIELKHESCVKNSNAIKDEETFEHEIYVDHIILDQLRNKTNVYEFEEEYYGTNYVKSHFRFLLVPFKVKYGEGNDYHWLFPEIYVFPNNIAILKMPLDIIKSNSDNIISNNLGGDISDIINLFGYIHNNNLSYSDLTDVVISTISDIIQHEFIEIGGLDSLILIDYEYMPNNITDISEKLKNEIYKSLRAPYDDFQFKAYQKREVLDYIDKRSIKIGHIVHYVKSNGGVITILDKELKNKIEQKYYEYYECQYLKEHNREMNILQKFVVQNMVLNLEYSLVLILLNHASLNVTILDIVNEKNVSKIKTKNIETELFLLDLLRTSYGTVLEQFNFFKLMMYDFLDEEQYNRKIVAVNTILEYNNYNRKRILNTSLSLLGVVFSFPGINASLTIINNAFYLISHKNVILISIVIWFLLLLIFIFVIWFSEIEKFVLKHMK